MDQRQISKWQQTRARGIWRFALLWTVALGGAMIAATAVFDYVVGSGRPIVENLKIRAPILLICAFVSGVGLWFISERRYKKSGTDTDSDTKG